MSNTNTDWRTCWRVAWVRDAVGNAIALLEQRSNRARQATGQRLVAQDIALQGALDAVLRRFGIR